LYWVHIDVSYIDIASFSLRGQFSIDFVVSPKRFKEGSFSVLRGDRGGWFVLGQVWEGLVEEGVGLEFLFEAFAREGVPDVATYHKLHLNIYDGHPDLNTRTDLPLFRKSKKVSTCKSYVRE
jgi:hypothetical protein